MLAAAIGDRAADEGDHRQRELGHLLGPEEAAGAEAARHHIEDDDPEFAEQGDDENGFPHPVHGAEQAAHARTRFSVPDRRPAEGGDVGRIRHQHPLQALRVASTMSVNFFTLSAPA